MFNHITLLEWSLRRTSSGKHYYLVCRLANNGNVEHEVHYLQKKNRDIQGHQLSPPLRRIYRVIETRAIEHEGDVAIPLLTRRGIAHDYRRIRVRSKRGGRAKRTGLTYPVASRMVKELIDLGLVVEERAPRRGERRGRPLGLPKPEPEPKPREPNVIIAGQKRRGAKSQ